MKRVCPMEDAGDSKVHHKRSCRSPRPMGTVSPDGGTQSESGVTPEDISKPNSLHTAMAKSLLLLRGNPVSPPHHDVQRPVPEMVQPVKDTADAYKLLFSKLTSKEESTQVTSCIYDVVLAHLRDHPVSPAINGAAVARQDDPLKEQARAITEMIQKKILSSKASRNIPPAPMKVRMNDSNNFACVSFEENTHKNPVVIVDDESPDKQENDDDAFYQRMIQRGYFTKMEHRGLVPDALLACLSQMRPCEIQERDRVGPYRELPLGTIGFCCPYCRGSADNGRYFPKHQKQLVDQQYDFQLVRHFTIQCPDCPADIRNAIVRLAQKDVAQPMPQRAKATRSTTVWGHVWRQLESTDAQDLAAAATLLQS